MNETIVQLENGVFMHTIYTEKFKTNLVATFVLTDLKKDEITQNALIPAVLRRGTQSFETMKEISHKMDEMYGAIFDASSDKIGNKQALQFYISTIEDAYALNGEKLLFQSLDFMDELLFHPTVQENVFREDYVEQEKNQLLELIKSRINDKASFAVNRTLEEIFPHDPFGVYKYGREEDVNAITKESLYKQYQKVIREGEIHLYLVGKFDVDSATNYVKGHFGNSLVSTKSNHQEMITFDKRDLTQIIDIKKIRDVQDVTQGKLVLAYDVGIHPASDELYVMNVYNAILGSSATSKLFQNVREKKSMAYTIRSSYIKHKAMMLITAGIEMDKYEQALSLIKKEVEDMRNGVFTEEDIENAKTFLENVYCSYTDDETTMVSLSIGQYLLNMTCDVNEMIQKMKDVTKEDIINLAQKVTLKAEYYLGN